MDDVIAFLLAGGRGERLMPLTDGRAKPAVPFGGKWYVIDPALYSLYYSGIQTIKVLTQFSSQPLIQHIRKSWPRRPNFDDYVEIIPAQQQIGNEWYTGTANAVFQNFNLIGPKSRFALVAIFAADHIFKFDVSQMREFHDQKNADFTICGKEVLVAEAAGRFGIIVVDENGRATDFEEKPLKPTEIPGRPGYCYASMGNYLAKTDVLREVLKEDALDGSSFHDFGNDVIPTMIQNGLNVFVYNFADNDVPGQVAPYWVDVGTIGTYWQANMDLAGENPALNLYSDEWSIMTPPDKEPPAKFARRACAEYSLLSGGDIIDGALILRSVLGRRVLAGFGSEINECILFDNVTVNEGVKLYRTIVCEDVIVPPNTLIGFDKTEDRKMGIIIDKASKVRVIPRGFKFQV